MKARFGRPYFSLENFSISCQQIYVIRYSGLISELNPLKWRISAVNDSVILTEDDIPGTSLAGQNPSSLKNEELRFWFRCRGDSLKLKTKPLLVKR